MVVAGPLANFLLTIVIFTWFIMTSGLPSIDPIVGQVLPDSPAQAAGLQTGDHVLRINETDVSSFSDIPYLISTNIGTPVTIMIDRAGKQFPVHPHPARR